MRTIALGGKGALALAALLSLAACERHPPLPTARPAEGTLMTMARTPADRTASPGRSVVLGTGWYANVEVDARDRVHLAWTDADRGDVFYGVTPPGELSPLTLTTVETAGAVGAHLRLALAPGDVPVLTYFHQDRRILRLALREADLPTLRKAGVEVDGEALPDEAPETRDPGEGMTAGWVGEDVAFGDDAGRGGAFVVDAFGRPHIVYYRPQQRLRYIRRPPSIPAYGPAARGIWQKIDVDEAAGGSHTMSAGLLARQDGTVVVSYANWNYFDSQLKIAVLDPGADRFRVSPATGLVGRTDGWHSSLLPVPGAEALDLYATSFGDHALWRARVFPGALAPVEREVILRSPGAAVARRAPDGTVYVLSRSPGDDQSAPGVYLVTLPGGAPARARRVLLERAAPRDAWIDLALRPDGRPVAVWTSRDKRALMLYAP